MYNLCKLSYNLIIKLRKGEETFMTLEQIKVKYAKEILDSKDKDTATSNVISKINGLTYTSGEKLSAADKQYLVDGIIEIITPKTNYGKRIILCEKDNSAYLQMLSAISLELSKVTGGK